MSYMLDIITLHIYRELMTYVYINIYVLGLVEANIALGKNMDAMLDVKEALKLRPKSAIGLVMLGKVINLKNTPESAKEVITTNGYNII
jgi:hypothetical protein